MITSIPTGFPVIPILGLCPSPNPEGPSCSRQLLLSLNPHKKNDGFELLTLPQRTEIKKRPLTKYSHRNTIKKNNKLNVCPAVPGLPEEREKKQKRRGK